MLVHRRGEGSCQRVLEGPGARGSGLDTAAPGAIWLSPRVASAVPWPAEALPEMREDGQKAPGL